MDTGFSPQLPPDAPTGNPKRPWLPAVGGQAGTDDGELLDLGYLLSILRRRALIIVGVTAMVTTAAGIKGKVNPSYQAGVQILAKPITVETQVVSSLPQALREDQRTPNNNTTATRGYDATKLRLLTSPSMLEPVANQLKAKYPDITADSLASQIEIKPIAETDIFEVRYRDSDPVRVTTILQAISKRYIDYSLEERLADTKQGISFIDKQLPAIKDRVSYWQAKLQAFRQQNTFFDPDTQSREIADQIANFRRQRLDNEVQLKQAVETYQDLKTQMARSPQDRLAALALRQSDSYRQLLTQLLTLDGQIAEQGSIFQPDSDNMKILRDQRSKLLPLLEREAERVESEVASQVRDLQARDQALRTTEVSLGQRMKNLSMIAREYTDIQRELQIATDNLNQFLAKRSALDIDSGQRQTPWEVMTPELSPQLISVKSNLLIGGLLGIFLGLVTAIVVDRLSNVFYTPEEIKKLGKLSLLGVIPFNQELPQIERVSLPIDAFQPVRQLGLGGRVKKFGSLPFLEAFRLLQTNLRLVNADQPIRSLVISSASPQDGKSTTAAYLAQAAASMGQRVLLVDAELRRPQLHYRLGLSNQQGLSDWILSSRDGSEFIQRSPLNDNLDVLTAGQIPSDPVTLLSSQKMHQLMDRFQAEYDLVIYDTPPMVGLSDAHLVAAKTDGLLLVSRIGKTNRDAYAHVIETLRMLPTKVLGVVANDSRKLPSNLYTSYYAQPISPPVAESLSKIPSS